MKQFLKDMFGGGDTSIKRVIAFLGFLFLAITMLLNSYSHEDIKPSEDLVDAVKVIVLVCIGGNVVEKFLAKKIETTTLNQNV
jgi:preprotein translocase subunit SecG